MDHTESINIVYMASFTNLGPHGADSSRQWTKQIRDMLVEIPAIRSESNEARSGE